jgi:phosphoribosylformylglycinamidine cyclo-ligase
MRKKLTYKDAGVDIDRADMFVESLKSIVKPTFRHEVLSGIGGFGSLFALNTTKYHNPILVASTDGVGTKLRIAFMMEKHDTIGIDLVAMCVNDVIVQGAEPLFMLDYLATGKLDQKVHEDVVRGIAAGCAEAGCALVGGETAEMPSFYSDGEYDVAGFVVGVVDKEKVIDGTSISVGDSIIGIGSSGIHSNGLSLARKVVFETLGMKPDEFISSLGCTVGEELLRPTHIYVKTILNLIRDFSIHGIAHITGGGLIDNIARILPNGCRADITLGSWDVLPVFDFLKTGGGIDDQEMMRTFNNGIGMVLIVSPEEEEDILQRLHALHEKAYVIGSVVSTDRSKKRVSFTCS